MSEALYQSENAKCVIVGASHGGVNVAFALRQSGWKGEIDIYDRLNEFPHQKPPLSKEFLLGKMQAPMMKLRAEQAFEKARINLVTGKEVESLNSKDKIIRVSGEDVSYDKLILSTGAEAFIPPFTGLETAKNVFTMRHMPDAVGLKACIEKMIEAGKTPQVAVIGAGYIGLEAASSLTKMGATITVIERESRVLQRVTAPEMSAFFTELHTQQGVNIITSASVASIQQEGNQQYVVCEDGTSVAADIILVGVGVRVNQHLAENAGLDIDNGIVVNAQCQTSDSDIYCIGDAAQHFSAIYQRNIRLESVQNAMDQANVAAKHLCGKEIEYNKVPWFWSDQFGLKLQIVGLLTGYTDVVVRQDANNPQSISVWYFENDKLLSIDAVNQPKAYMLGMKLIPNEVRIDKQALASAEEPLTLDAIAAS